MQIDEIVISRAIVEGFCKELMDSTETDVAVVGGGPAGLTASYYLAKEGIKTVLFEKRLSIGGGMWGGGMMFNKCIFQKESKRILDELEINTKKYEENYYITDSIETVSALCLKCKKAGTKLFNLISVEDVMIREEKVTGLVINWSATGLANLHVDPLTVRTKFVVDATGHDSEVAKIIVRKIGKKLKTETGDLLGEKPMWAEVGETTIVKHTKEIYPNVYACGMAANAIFGGPRMGPIFGGMLLSGEKVAKLLIKKFPAKKA